MRTINLLPRKPFLDKWFYPMLAGIIVLCVLTSIGLAYGTVFLEGQHQRQLDEINATAAAIRDMTQQREPDPLSMEFDRYKQLIEALQSTQYDWVGVMDTIALFLPETARLQSSEYAAESKRLTISADFRLMEDAAAYVGALRASGVFSEVFVSNLSKAEPDGFVQSRTYYTLTVILTLQELGMEQAETP